MKNLILLAFVSLLSFNLSFAQDISKHSFTLNLGGLHQVPIIGFNSYMSYDLNFASHIGTTYRLQLAPRQSLRASVDCKNMQAERIDGYYENSGTKDNYNEFQIGVGYEFLIKKGKLEAYVNIDAIGIYSENSDHYWNDYFNTNTIRTENRLGYGGSMSLGLRRNVSKKLAIGLETNARYLFNKSRQEIQENSNNSIPSINYYNFLEFNPISAITVKYNI